LLLVCDEIVNIRSGEWLTHISGIIAWALAQMKFLYEAAAQ
jgi:hypothetical protein